LADPTETGLLREIDEELRQEHYAKLWKLTRGYIIGGTLLLVGSVAGYQAWRTHDTETRQDQGNRFSLALEAAENGRLQAAADSLRSLATESSGAYGFLSRFQAAAFLAESGDTLGALSIYREIVEDPSVDPLYRDLATLFGVLHELDQGDAAAMKSRLAPLLDASNPWRHSAKELNAYLTARAGDNAKAQGLFKELSENVTTPPSIRKRASDMAASLNLR
jgi:hypothetical protein